MFTFLCKRKIILIKLHHISINIVHVCISEINTRAIEIVIKICFIWFFVWSFFVLVKTVLEFSNTDCWSGVSNCSGWRRTF